MHNCRHAWQLPLAGWQQSTDNTNRWHAPTQWTFRGSPVLSQSRDQSAYACSLDILYSGPGLSKNLRVLNVRTVAGATRALDPATLPTTQCSSILCLDAMITQESEGNAVCNSGKHSRHLCPPSSGWATSTALQTQPRGIRRVEIDARIDPGRVLTGGATNLDRDHWSQDLTTDGLVPLRPALCTPHRVMQ